MSHYTDYLMPFGWGESDKPKAGRKQHPITMLKVGENYTPEDDKDKGRVFMNASRLRKRDIMDVKYANGMFTRIK